MSASVNLPLHHEVRKFSSGTGSPGWSRKKGRKMVVVSRGQWDWVSGDAVYRESCCASIVHCRTSVIVARSASRYQMLQTLASTTRTCWLQLCSPTYRVSTVGVVLILHGCKPPQYFTKPPRPTWRGGATGKAFGLAISRSRAQILLDATLCNNLRQVV